MTILYKKDSKGKIRSLEIWSDEGTLYQKSGLLVGKKITHFKVCKPKNVGRSNETTITTQAESEVLSLVAKKTREGYFNTEIEAKSSNIKLPMLAKDYFVEKHKIKDATIGTQAKLDGIRCNIHCNIKEGTIKAISRTNKELLNIEHITDEINSYMQLYHQVYEEIIFDGELYLHGKSFQEVTKLVKNKPTDVFVKYHIYDIIDTSTDFTKRDFWLDKLITDSGLEHSCKVITASILNNPSSIKNQYLSYIAKGYEGMMIRTLHSKYKVNGRSSDLLKYKEFIDIALPIKDITPNDANPKHGTVWVKFNGNLQKTGAKLSHADREELLTNKQNYLGQMAEIRYFEETDDGLMRFPVYHGIRIDK